MRSLFLAMLMLGLLGSPQMARAGSAPASSGDALGAPGSTVCATDTGSCSLNALLQRLAQRVTALISTLGTPLQAGGNVALAAVSLTPTDRGGTIATGGTAQQLAASNGSRKAIVLQNPCAATENLNVAVIGNATVAGAGNFAELLPCGSTSITIAGQVYTGAITINAATTGHRWSSTEWQ